MTRWTADEAAAALDAVSLLWQALAEDDDLTALRVTAADLHAQLGTGPGYASRLRDSLGRSVAECEQMGIASKVRIVDDVMVFVSIYVGPDKEPIMVGQWGPERRRLWALWTAVERGRWVVGGSYQPPEDGWPEETEYLDLPHAPGSEGPVQ